MASNLHVRPRRFRVTLWHASPDFEPLGELCEVISAKVCFAMNQIPMATVELPHGEEVHTGDSATTADEIDAIVAARTPLCIMVERNPLPMHATESTLNKDDPDCKWPEERVAIFKGYASSYSFNKTANSIGTVLYLQHWLCDLSAVSAYCPRSHSTNPTAFAIDVNTFTTYNDLNNSSRHWSVLQSELSSHLAVDPGSADSGVWNILKGVFEQLCKASLENNKSAIGAISEEYVERMQKALGRFVPHIDWHVGIYDAVMLLEQCIIAAIGSEVAASWTNTTIWDEIAGSMAGMFYFSVVPTVDHAHIIPRPGAVAEECIELNENDLLSFSTNIATTPILDACILAYQNGTEHLASNPSFVKGPMYPERRKIGEQLVETKGGPIAVTSMPPWMQVRCILFAIKMQDHILSPHHPFAPKPAMASATSKEDLLDPAIEAIGRQLVQFDYFSKVFAGRDAKFAMPFRADIAPGASVHVQINPVIPSSGKKIDIYGTVEMVVMNIGENQATTQVSLTNIRSKDEYESDIYNGGPVFYSELWSGTDVPLYSES